MTPLHRSFTTFWVHSSPFHKPFPFSSMKSSTCTAATISKKNTSLHSQKANKNAIIFFSQKFFLLFAHFKNSMKNAFPYLHTYHPYIPCGIEHLFSSTSIHYDFNLLLYIQRYSGFQRPYLRNL